MLNLYIFVESDILLDLEDTLHLNRAIVRQGGKPDCTPSTHPLLGTEHLEEMFSDFFEYFFVCLKPPSWGWRSRWWWWCTPSPLSSQGLRSPSQMSWQSSPPWVNITAKTKKSSKPKIYQKNQQKFGSHDTNRKWPFNIEYPLTECLSPVYFLTKYSFFSKKA